MTIALANIYGSLTMKHAIKIIYIVSFTGQLHMLGTFTDILL